MLCISVGLGATNGTKVSSTTENAVSFEPGETIYIEVPGITTEKALFIKSHITDESVGAEWLGYCASYDVICVKAPSIGQENFENALKQVIGGYKIFSASQVEYSISNPCFTN